MKGSLIIISNFNFQSRQGAAFSRLLCYAKALERDFNVHITSKYYSSDYKSTEQEKILSNLFISSSYRQKQKSKIYRIFFRQFDFIGSYRYLKEIDRSFCPVDNNIIYLFYGSEFSLTLVTLIYFKLIKKRKVFIEKSELEMGVIINQGERFSLKSILMSFLFPVQFVLSLIVDLLAFFFSGAIVISKRLKVFYDRFSLNVLYVPILTETSPDLPFSKLTYKDFFFIGFTGAISEKKEGIFGFIKALGKLPPGVKNIIRLNIYGNGDKDLVEKFLKENSRYGLLKNVVIHDLIDSQAIPAKLSDQNLLVLSRISNLQTEYGFSTKLAEYLASGVPVLASRVSDNSVFLKDNVNALLVEPGDIDEMTRKILFAVQNPSIIQKIGLEGRKIAEQFFYYGLYSEKLKMFLLGHLK